MINVTFIQLIPAKNEAHETDSRAKNGTTKASVFRPGLMGRILSTTLNPGLTGHDQKKTFCCATTRYHAGLTREDRSASGAAAPDRTGSARHGSSEEIYL
jgi:hypothetical protein